MAVRFCIAFGFMFSAGAAHAGVTIEFETDPGVTCGDCLPANTDITVDVVLRQDAGGSDQRLRMIELDFAQTSPLLEIRFPTTHDRATVETSDDVHFWRFDSLAGCLAAPSFCGFNHHLDFDMGSGPVDTRQKVMSATFIGRAVDPTAQFLLPGGANPSRVTVGRFIMRASGLGGSYTLNVVNAADPDVNRRARVDFGFDPHLTWRAGNASPNNVSGGVRSFGVSSFACECPPPSVVWSVPPATPVGSPMMPMSGTLWRSQRNVIRIGFFGQLSAAPTPNQMEIRQLLPAGAFGPNLAANGFTFTLENGPNGFNSVLRIADDTTSDFSHRQWYAVRNTGAWASAGPFELQWPVQVGDSGGNNNVLAADVLTINSRVSCISNCGGDQVREDIDGDTRILSGDVLQANARVSSLPVAKPTGH